MKIDISMKELGKLHVVATRMLEKFYNKGFEAGQKKKPSAPSGWVSHHVSTDNPPSVMTVATTEKKAEGADYDIDKKERLEKDAVRVWLEAQYGPHRRLAEDIGASVVRRLLDFEAWTDTVVANDGDIDYVRFHYDCTHAGNMVFLYCVAYYRNADKRRRPREVFYSKHVSIPEDDDSLAGVSDEMFYDAVASVSEFIGADPLDYDKWLGTPPSEKEQETVPCCGGEITRERMMEMAQKGAREVCGILTERLKTLDEWADKKFGERKFSSFVTVWGDTVDVLVSDFTTGRDGEPVLHKKYVVTDVCDVYSMASRAMNQICNIVFGKFEELDYGEYQDWVAANCKGCASDVTDAGDGAVE